MSTSQVKNFRFFSQLLRSLKTYGLNPYEWRLDRSTTVSTGQLALRHREDPEFIFTADWWIHNGAARLRELRLASL